MALGVLLVAIFDGYNHAEGFFASLLLSAVLGTLEPS
jgi:hypothetical protein